MIRAERAGQAARLRYRQVVQGRPGLAMTPRTSAEGSDAARRTDRHAAVPCGLGAARGTDVDHQTDIFSFGAVVYREMLYAGVSPFAGDTVTDVIVAVLDTRCRHR